MTEEEGLALARVGFASVRTFGPNPGMLDDRFAMATGLPFVAEHSKHFGRFGPSYALRASEGAILASLRSA